MCKLLGNTFDRLKNAFDKSTLHMSLTSTDVGG